MNINIFLMKSDPVYSRVNFLCSFLMVCMSIGYFAFDTLDGCLFNFGAKSTAFVIVHHSSVVFCFCLSIIKHRYISYSVVALVQEVNSIFLHIRQLYTLQGYAKQTFVYKFISIVTIVTFVIFRFLVVAWMAKWISLNDIPVPIEHFACGWIIIILLFIGNFLMFRNLIHSDYATDVSSKTSVKQS